MKIAYIGNFTQKHCTEVHLALTLEDLGHEVVRLQENELEPFWVASVKDVDMVLYTRTWGDRVSLTDLDRLRELKIPTVSYHLDLYVGLARKYLHEGKTLDEVLQTDPFWRTDFVFTPDGDKRSQEVFERNGVKHYYMRPGVYKGECYMDEPIWYLHDVLFVGGGDYPGSPNGYGHPEWPYRDELIQWLRTTYNDKFAKFGHPQETIRNEKLNRLYADTKVTVGDSVCVGFDHEYYWSDRVCETLGRGGFLIHPWIKGMDEEFVDGEHLVYYEFGNWAQLKEKIDYYLEHDEERERIRKAGHEFVKNHATYHDRLTQMLKTVQITGALKETNDAQRQAAGLDAPVKINLGAGSEPTEGWINVDWLKLPGIDVVQNLLETPWHAFDSNVADEIKAIDVLEHMPNYTPDNRATAVEFVRECWRILRPGGVLTIQVPHWQSPNCWIDLTHVRGFDQRSMDYFDPSTDIGSAYGYYSPDRKFRVEASVSIMENQTDPANNGKPSNVTFRMTKV